MRRNKRRRPSDRQRLLIGSGVAWWAARKLREHSYQLDGRVVLITGGSRGLGLALAHEFGAQEARIIICAPALDGEPVASQRRRQSGRPTERERKPVRVIPLLTDTAG